MTTKNNKKGRPTVKHPSTTAKSSPKTRALARSQMRSKSSSNPMNASPGGPKIVEAGVGWGNVVRAVASIASRSGKQAPYGTARSASQISRAKKADAKRAQTPPKTPKVSGPKPGSRAAQRETVASMRATNEKLAAKRKQIRAQQSKDAHQKLIRKRGR